MKELLVAVHMRLVSKDSMIYPLIYNDLIEFRKIPNPFSLEIFWEERDGAIPFL
jgi:hypothetical protein